MATEHTEQIGECDQCLNTGWRQFKDTWGISRADKCTACGYWDKSRGSAPGVPDEEKAATLDTYTVTKDNSEAIKHARLFLDGIHPDLYLWGGVGTGKTKLACCILNQIWTVRRQGVRFVRVPELMLRLQPGSDSTDKTFDDVVNVPVLCLDDVGASKASDFARRMLQAIYDARLDRKHRTIWTSNLDLDELATFLGAGGEDVRLPSRIVGQAMVIELDGKDWRVRRGRARAASHSSPDAKRKARP